LDKEINKVSKKTATGRINLIDSKSAEKSVEKIEALYATLTRKIEVNGLAGKTLKEDVKVVKALSDALKECEKVAEGNSKE
jgi:hypothetical protein